MFISQSYLTSSDLISTELSERWPSLCGCDQS